MVKEIVKDEAFLSQKSAPATPEDIQIGEDLRDTLKANEERCVGLAANMIGELKNIIVVSDEGKFIVMYNPKIVRSADKYNAEEGCLSLEGTRKTKRFRTVMVKYQDADFKVKIRNFSGFTAQIIQHEVDHCNGVII